MPLGWRELPLRWLRRLPPGEWLSTEVGLRALLGRLVRLCMVAGSSPVYICAPSSRTPSARGSHPSHTHSAAGKPRIPVHQVPGKELPSRALPMPACMRMRVQFLPRPCVKIISIAVPNLCSP